MESLNDAIWSTVSLRVFGDHQRYEAKHLESPKIHLLYYNIINLILKAQILEYRAMKKMLENRRPELYC